MRQVDVSSQFPFNLFYQEMIGSSAECTGYIKIHGTSYNLFVYGEDTMLASVA